MGERSHSQKSYVCSFFDCKSTFTKSWKLEAHLCKHTGLKPFSCEKCEKSYCTRYQLSRHDLSHSGEKPHKCQVTGCSEAFVTNASLKNHMARIHDHQKNQYECDHQGCGKNFNKRCQLKAHKCEHQQGFPFHCSFNGCTREFPSNGKLKHHEKVHKGYPCDTELCSFQGKTWTEYVKHRREHKAKVPCGNCEKLFSNAWFLHLHELQAHSGAKRSFSCPREGCNKKFTRRFNLESHVLADHDGKKPFSCAYAGCGKSFAMKESLWRHGVVHDPSKRKLKKRHPTKNQPWRVAQQGKKAAAGSQEETNKLAAKLGKTTLQDDRS